MGFDQHIEKILSFSNIDHFSAVEIRTAYLVLKKDEKMDKSEARRFVYSELLKLVNLGWLKKLVSTKKGIARYVKTESFNADLLNIQVEPISIDKVAPVSATKPNNAEHKLMSRLQCYKTELLEGLGEAEECKSLRIERPDMHDSLLTKYNEVREGNARLLGKIKMLESFIKSNTEN
jgi:hypothetical protein